MGPRALADRRGAGTQHSTNPSNGVARCTGPPPSCTPGALMRSPSIARRAPAEEMLACVPRSAVTPPDLGRREGQVLNLNPIQKIKGRREGQVLNLNPIQKITYSQDDSHPVVTPMLTSTLWARALADRRGAGTSAQHQPQQRRRSMHRATSKLHAWGVDAQSKHRKASTCGGDAGVRAPISGQATGFGGRRGGFSLCWQALQDCAPTDSSSESNTEVRRGVAQTGA